MSKLVFVVLMAGVVGAVLWSFYGDQITEQAQTTQSEVQSKVHERAQSFADALE